MKVCKKPDCPMAFSVIYYRAFELVDKKNDELLGKVIRFYINEQYARLSHKFPDNNEIKMSCALFLYEVQKQRSQAFVELRKIHKSSLSIPQRYIAYKCK